MNYTGYGEYIMDRISLKAQERDVLGKKVKKYRKQGLVPGHVFGNGLETEHVFITAAEFSKVFKQAGETGLIDLKIGEEKVRPVLIRELQHDARRGELLHIDFYQVNLKEKVKVYVPIILIGEEHESVHLGDTVIINPVSEVEVEALPTDLIDKIEVDITRLQQVDDSITVADLNIDREKITILTPEEEVVAKMDTAVTQEMQELLEEQEAEAAAATEGEEGAEGEEKAEGEEGTEGESEESKQDDNAEKSEEQS